MPLNELPEFFTKVYELDTKKYCELIELVDAYPIKKYIDRLHKLLTELYFKITALPGADPLFEGQNKQFVPENDYNYIHQKLSDKFTEYDKY